MQSVSYEKLLSLHGDASPSAVHTDELLEYTTMSTKQVTHTFAKQGSIHSHQLTMRNLGTETLP